ncbi:MAG: chemotaxis protein CheA [Bacteroidota bacterium]|nr:chemotaxis protein CheA [Bacteroidota bacterium]
MDSFREKFIEEANELILLLEEALITLEDEPENKKQIHEIFRIMHTLKGSGAMFGFNNISNFAHNLENLYETVKEGKINVSHKLINITLRAVDQIKLLLDDKIDKQTLENIEEITEEVLKISDTENSTIEVDNSNIKKKNTKKLSTYYIKFVPNKDICKNGTNPLYLIDELVSLGKAKAFASLENIPNLHELDEKDCLITWSIFLATDNSKEVIEDVFIFVIDESIIEIQQLANNDLFLSDKFNNKLVEYNKDSNKIELNEIIEIIEEETEGKVENKDEDKSKDKDENKEKNLNSIEISNKLDFVEQNTKKEIVQEDNIEKKISSIRVSSSKIDKLINLASELITAQARLDLFTENEKNADLFAISESIEKLTRQLRDNVFEISLVPLKSIQTKFKRLIRDLSSEFNKEIEFIAEGTETELDKNIIESISDPLLHIFRNSIDHGIEDKETRIAKNKNKKGKITLKAYYSGSEVHIKISDDGKGIDTKEIMNTAIKKGIIKADDELKRKDILNLMFLPGFSTATKITKISGRGIGMDVVKQKISEIRGNVSIDSKIDEGTSITIKLPLSLSIIDGLLTKIDNSQFIFPVSVIDKIYYVSKKELSKAFNNVITLNEVQYPFLNLRSEFNKLDNTPDLQQVIVVKYGNKKMGLVVDEVLKEYQAVLKPLGKYYKAQKYFSGASILGDGSVALMIDTNKIIETYTLN